MNIQQIIETAIVDVITPTNIMIGYSQHFTEEPSPSSSEGIFFKSNSDVTYTSAELYIFMLRVYKKHIKWGESSDPILPRELYQFFSSDKEDFPLIEDSETCINCLLDDGANTIEIEKEVYTRTYPYPELIGVWNGAKEELVSIQEQIPDLKFIIFWVEKKGGKVLYNENT